MILYSGLELLSVRFCEFPIKRLVATVHSKNKPEDSAPHLIFKNVSLSHICPWDKDLICF